VRPAGEILATLDADACMDRLPFMPEMLPFVGRRFTVSAVARKVCDTTREGTGNRLLHDTVYLDDLRCDGSGHDGCQAGCLIMWRESWLRRVSENGGATDDDAARTALEARSRAATTREPGVYRCQATELTAASEPFPPGDRGRKYLHEVRVGNVGIVRFLRVLARAVGRKLGRTVGLVGDVPISSPGPPADMQPLDLRPGDVVRVKSKREIAPFVDETGGNRGLSFDWEMVPHCGRTYRVQDRVQRIIDENTGRMIEMKRDCLILEGVACSGDLSDGRWFCPRAIYPYWREAWLERVEARIDGAPPSTEG
jgi:hypothetical protein